MPPKIKKVCIFCGEKPIDKNNEHVIPQWLIKLTGDKKRPFSLFLFDIEKGFSKNDSTPFDQFVFPACTTCNSDYSKLEESAKRVINAILSKEELSSDDFLILFDWLDKIRIGMWLAIRYRDNNAFNVDPNFYITQRIRRADRLLKIIQTTEPSHRLTISGVNSPAFMKMPSAFSITINQFSFISVSSNFLLARRIGWPYPIKQTFDSNGLYKMDMQYGLERVIHPVVRLPIQPGTIIFQAAIPPEINDLVNDLYKSDFIVNTKFENYPNLSKIFIQNKSQRTEIFLEKNKSWIPEPYNLESNKFADFSAVETMKIQNHLWLEALNLQFENKAFKKKFTKFYHLAKNFNLLQISNFKTNDKNIS